MNSFYLRYSIDFIDDNDCIVIMYCSQGNIRINSNLNSQLCSMRTCILHFDAALIIKYLLL